jgi:hypothetical protein
MADPLETACSLVGRFQYHFARVEQKIDQAVIKLLDLDDKAGPVVTGSVAFASKVNFVRTSAYQQAVNAKDKEFAEKTCGDVFAVNNVRLTVIHSSFELFFALRSEPTPGRAIRINSGEFALQLLAP